MSEDSAPAGGARVGNVGLKWTRRPRSDMADQAGADGAADGTGGTDAATAHVETVHATGHEHVSADHASTFEVTTDDFLTPAGDCILAIGADRAPADFDDGFVAACRDADARIEATLTVHPGDDRSDPPHRVTVTGRGHPELTFDSDRGAVARTSDYVDERTVMVEADAAAADLDRALVAALADGADCRLRLRVTTGD